MSDKKSFILFVVVVIIVIALAICIVVSFRNQDTRNTTTLQGYIHERGIDSPLPISKIETAKGTVGWFNGNFTGFLGVSGEISGNQTQGMSITVYWKGKNGLCINTLPISKTTVVRGKEPTFTVILQDFARMRPADISSLMNEIRQVSEAEFIEKHAVRYILTLPPNIYDKEFGE